MNKFEVLDFGSIEVMSDFENDQAIVDAARVSYDAESTKHTSTNEELINYLVKHEHWSPFEQASIKLKIKIPIAIARQWMRHRSHHFNEISGRYSILKNEMYLPCPVYKQHKTMKQGRDENETVDCKEIFENVYLVCSSAYNSLLEMGVAREIARLVLPMSTYTIIIDSATIRDWLMFCKQRCDLTAQWEIRQYTNVILNEILVKNYPLTVKAFLKYK